MSFAPSSSSSPWIREEVWSLRFMYMSVQCALLEDLFTIQYGPTQGSWSNTDNDTIVNELFTSRSWHVHLCPMCTWSHEKVTYILVLDTIFQDFQAERSRQLKTSSKNAKIGQSSNFDLWPILAQDPRNFIDNQSWCFLYFRVVGSISGHVKLPIWSRENVRYVKVAFEPQDNACERI